MTTVGWGASGWGSGSWGTGIVDLELLEARPVRENVVRLYFNTAVLFTGVLDPADASNPDRYQIVIVEGTMVDGSDPRPVTPIIAAVATVAFSGGSAIDVTVDRNFSAYPGSYLISVNQLQSTTGGLLLAGSTSATFDGLVRFKPPPRRDTSVPSRDIANPQTRSALFDPLPVTDNELLLGTIPVDENGDYAFDEGITNLKKRIYRRLVTSKGGFAALPEYGIGFPDQLKKLGRASLRAELAAEAEKQIALEPEVERVSVVVVLDATTPGQFLVRIKAKAKVSDDPIDFDVPFSPIGSS